MLRRVILVLFLTTSVAARTFADATPVKANPGMLWSEVFVGMSGLTLGVLNAAHASPETRSVPWGLLGLGVGVASLALGASDPAEIRGFDIVAGTTAILGSSFRLRSPRIGSLTWTLAPGHVAMRTVF